MLEDHGFCETSLVKEYESLCNSNGWNILFQRIKNNATFKTMNNECNVSRSNENRFKNKYREIVAYDFNRILLPRTYFNSDYINASLVKVNERNYIVTQYPYKTFGLFWLMVWEYKCPGIVMLGKFDETETEFYFPKDERELYINSVDDERGIFSIQVLEFQSHNGFFQRKLRILNLELGSFHDLWHFEFWSWPDQMVPKSMLTFLTLMGMVRQLKIFDSQDHHSVIHCSAGAGRSGTFCLIDLAIAKFEQSGNLEDIDISGLVVNLRSQRMGMVHSVAQLKFSYKAIIEAFTLYKQNGGTNFDSSYLLQEQCSSNSQGQRRELQYSSSSESATSDMIYLKSSDEDIDSDLLNDDQTKTLLRNNNNSLVNEVNSNSQIYTKDQTSTSISDNKSSLEQVNVRQEIINKRKSKNQEKIEKLSTHLKENNLKRFRVWSLVTSSNSLSILEELNDSTYWPLVVIGGTIAFMGACFWLKYNPFK